jgi:nucleoid DNA-binding protein
MKKTQSEFIRELASKYNTTQIEMEQILNSVFRFTKTKMESGELKNIMVPHLGKFVVTQHARRRQSESFPKSEGHSEFSEEPSTEYRGDRTESQCEGAGL